MNIVFISQYYYPGISSVAQLLTDMAEGLARKGHAVEVICSNKKFIPPDSTPLTPRETINNVKVIRVRSTNFGKRHPLGRLFDYLTFYASAFLAVFSIQKPDLVVTLTIPPMVGLLGIAVKWIYGCKFIYWTMDLYPDVLVALNAVKKESLGYKIFSSLAQRIYRSADLVLTLGPYMKGLIADREVPEEKLGLLYNWSDGDRIKKIPDEQNAFLQENSLQGRFTVLYAGNMGLGHTFDTVLEVARRLEQNRDILFCFVGGGSRRAEIEAWREKFDLENIMLLPYYPPSRMDEIVSAADVSLITMRKGMEGIIVPSKLYGTMAGESPIIMVQSGDNEVGDAVRAANCGFVIADGDVEGLNEKILTLYREPRQREELGRNARRYFLEHFDRPLAVERFHDYVVEILGESAVPG